MLASAAWPPHCRLSSIAHRWKDCCLGLLALQTEVAGAANETRARPVQETSLGGADPQVLGLPHMLVLSQAGEAGLAGVFPDSKELKRTCTCTLTPV